MLFELTTIVDISALAVTLWMAFYLFGRGFPSRITLRAVIVLLLLSVFFFSVYSSLFHHIVGTVTLRAVIVVVGLGTWYGLTYQLMSVQGRERLRWMKISIYALCGITAILMLGSSGAFSDPGADPLYMPHMNAGLSYILYLLFLLLICLGISYNLLTDKRIGLASQGKYFLVASIFIVAAVAYGVVGVTSAAPSPRLIMDVLIFCGVTLLGISVARHQTLVERRTTLQDFPASGLAILGLSAFYAFLSLRWGLPVDLFAALIAVVILTHSTYDLVREFLERLRIRNESGFRRQLRQLENQVSDEETLQLRLQEGLDLLCQTLGSSGGIIATRRNEDFVVIADKQSVPVGTRLSAALVGCEDVTRVDGDQLPGILWMAPAFEAQTQVALVGLRQPKARLDYSAGDLDLLAEFTDRVGTIVSLSNLQPGKTSQIQELIAESEANASKIQIGAKEMLATITTSPDAEFIKLTEDGLRHLSDYGALGESPLAARTGISGDSHVARGKNLKKLLTDSIEALRPAAEKPSGAPPREWYSYLVLHDAYVQGIPNREIMTRLYISEGTFNRTRRNAVRSLARILMENQKTSSKAD